MSKTIAACLIVKNEEAMLARCLESVKEADAIYILDTGSQDKTVEIARQYTDNVFLDFIWTDDFAGAQNHLLEKVRGKEDVILSIDADEYLNVPFENVRAAAELMKDMCRVKMIAENHGDERHRLRFGFGRLFRNSPEIFWYQNAHKHLSIPGEGEEVGDVSIIFGRSPAHDKDPDRTLRILEMVVARDGEHSGRNLYYLGREYWYKAFGERREEMLRKCTATLGRYVQISTWPAEKAEAFLVMSQAYSAMGLDNDARDSVAQSIILNSNFKEAIQWMADISTPENSLQWKRMAKTANNRDVMWDRVPRRRLINQRFIYLNNTFC